MPKQREVSRAVSKNVSNVSQKKYDRGKSTPLDVIRYTYSGNYVHIYTCLINNLWNIFCCKSSVNCIPKSRFFSICVKLTMFVLNIFIIYYLGNDVHF